MTDEARSVDADSPRNSNNIRALERGLKIFAAFDAEHPEQTLSEVARSVGLTRAVARRFLHTLVDLGYMQTDGRLFKLTPRVLHLGYTYLAGLGMPEIARHHLEALVDEINESSDIAVLDGPDVTYVARIPSRRLTDVAINIGKRFPAYTTSSGRILLAAGSHARLEEYLRTTDFEAHTRHTVTDRDELRRIILDVRDAGYASVDQEGEIGRCSVAVPIQVRGQVVAALSVTLHAGRGEAAEEVQALIPTLRQVAKAIQVDMEALPPSTR